MTKRANYWVKAWRIYLSAAKALGADLQGHSGIDLIADNFPELTTDECESICTHVGIPCKANNRASCITK